MLLHRNTDDEETQPMYDPQSKMTPPVVHDHPLPELDPDNIAPDGIATPRSKTERLPASWLVTLAMMLIVTTGGCKRRSGDAQVELAHKQLPGAICESSQRSYVDLECVIDNRLQFCNVVAETVGCWSPGSTTSSKHEADQ